MSTPITVAQLREWSKDPSTTFNQLNDALRFAADQIDAALVRASTAEARIGSLTEALHLAISIAEDHIHSEYDGTGLVDGLLEQLGPSRAALARHGGA